MRKRELKNQMLMLLCAAVLVLAGCGKTESKSQGSQEAGAESKAVDHIDVDLTSMSSTMVYSEVYNMLEQPENYLGKTVKMRGAYSYNHYNSTNTDIFACVIRDATACCAQGIEFVLTDDYVFPDDYPKEGDPITVVGVFDTYMERDYMYCTLRNARLV